MIIYPYLLLEMKISITIIVLYFIVSLPLHLTSNYSFTSGGGGHKLEEEWKKMLTSHPHIPGNAASAPTLMILQTLKNAQSTNSWPDLNEDHKSLLIFLIYSVITDMCQLVVCVY